MDLGRFWKLIDECRAIEGDCDQWTERLIGKLSKLTPKEILAFEQRLSELMDESYRAELWMATEVVLDGCSDDAFDYFRYWLIWQGREVFEKVLATPDSLADVADASADFDCQVLGNAGPDAYRHRTGDEMPEGPATGRSKMKGKILGETGIRRKLPKLWAKFRAEVPAKSNKESGARKRKGKSAPADVYSIETQTDVVIAIANHLKEMIEKDMEVMAGDSDDVVDPVRPCIPLVGMLAVLATNIVEFRECISFDEVSRWQTCYFDWFKEWFVHYTKKSTERTRESATKCFDALRSALGE